MLHFWQIYFFRNGDSQKKRLRTLTETGFVQRYTLTQNVTPV